MTLDLLKFTDSTKALDVRLDRIEQSTHVSIPQSFLNSLTIERRDDFIKKTINYRIASLYWGKEVRRHECYRDVPTTWWQHLKVDLFPAWLRRRFPVKTERIYSKLSHYHVCPHIESAPSYLHFDFTMKHGDCSAK